MGKSKNKNSSELQHLKGKIRQLEKELKYYRRRDHIEHTIVDEAPVEITNARQCPSCKSGILVEYDWTFVLVDKCSHCEFRITKKK